VLIARAQRIKGIPTARAARDSGLSTTRFLALRRGYRTPVRGMHVRVTPPPLTLARIAAATGITAAELTAAGRPDAARLLAGLPARRS
jgi:hypothetical protein